MEGYIYQIRNVLNDGLYIGSTNNFRNRSINHKLDLKKNKHHSKYLQNAYNKYGKDNFEFTILAKCPINKMIELEQWYIDNLNPKYNMSLIAGRVSVPRTQEWKDKIGNKNKGRKYTEQQKSNMKQFGWNKKTVYKICPNTFEILDVYESGLKAALLNNVDKSNLLACINGKIILCNGYMYCRTADYSIDNMIKRQKLSKQYKEVYQFDMNNNFIKRYGNISLAAKENNTSSSNIIYNLKGKTKSAGGYKWSYIKQINPHGY